MTARKTAGVVALLWALAGAAAAQDTAAQDLPRRTDPFVIDGADLIDAPTEDRIRTRLAELKADTGVEAAVLTLPGRAGYVAAETDKAFARAVFDGWGLGRAEWNDGLLLVVLAGGAPGERSAVMTLGAGYDQGYDVTAADIVGGTLLPALRAGRTSDGIAAAASAMADRIGRRFAADRGMGDGTANGTGDGTTGRPGSDWLVAAAFAAATAAMLVRTARRRTAGRAGGIGQSSPSRRDERDRPQRDPDRHAGSQDLAGRDRQGRSGDAGGGGRSGDGGAGGRW